MAHEYVEQRDGGLYVAGSRVALASIIYPFLDGTSPESIQQSFPSLSLAQVYGAIAFYLNHPRESEADLQCLDEALAELERTGQPPSDDLRKRLAEARRRRFAEQT
ncbi:MAG: DUF433 domain-containing protein [Bryobacterales bacterium]